MPDAFALKCLSRMATDGSTPDHQQQISHYAFGRESGKEEDKRRMGAR